MRNCRDISCSTCGKGVVEQDGEETPASDKLHFSWQGRDFALLVCEDHVDGVRDELTHLSELAAPEGQASRSQRAPREPRQAPSPAEPSKTLFSQLSDDEKSRFRIWADMPNARRIGDARVKQWTEAGKP